MKTVYIGGTKFIDRHGRLFRIAIESEAAAVEAEWADGVLSKPAVIYPNGQSSHEVAGRVLEVAEDTLVDFMVVTADQLGSAAK